jgi:hypothetical protein
MAATPASPPAAVAQHQTDPSKSDSDSYSSTDNDSSSCKIIESGKNEGKTSFICLSGDIRRPMLDKVKANSSKGNPNASFAEIAMIMFLLSWL